MKGFTHTALLCLSVTLSFVSLGSCDQAVFFDAPNYGGNSLTLSISGGCYKFKKGWASKVASVQVQDAGCLMGFTEEDCAGQSVKLLPDSKTAKDLGKAGLAKKLRSASLCFEISFRSADYFEERKMKPTEYAGGRKHDYRLSQAARQSLEINLYDQANFGGSIFTLTLSTSGDCYTIKQKWMSRVSSLEPMGNCLKIYDRENCEGKYIELQPTSSSTRNLKKAGFDKRMKSMKLCSPPEEGAGADADDDAADDQYRRGNKNEDNSSQLDNISVDKEIIELALQEHNKYRRLHGVPDLKWDVTLQKTAQKHANYLATTNKFQHSTDNDYGENLAGTSTPKKTDALLEGIDLWYGEMKHYDFSNSRASLAGVKAGHFTQLVWKSTTHVGVAMKWNTKRNWWVVVANYNPPGNFKGEYETNVFRPTNRRG